MCVCVCETHLKDSVTPSVLVLFREQSMPVGSVLSFSENSFMSLALCYLFQRTVIFPVPCKGISFKPLVFALVLCENS